MIVTCAVAQLVTRATTVAAGRILIATPVEQRKGHRAAVKIRLVAVMS